MRSTNTEVTLVAAYAKGSRVIGKDGEMSWHYPEDLNRFRDITIGGLCVMGRITFESILDRLGRPLEGRQTIVLTSQAETYKSDVATRYELSDRDQDMFECLASPKDVRDRIYGYRNSLPVYICGGESVYNAFIHEADELEITEIDADVTGDRTFPRIPGHFTMDKMRDGRNEDLQFLTYVNRESPIAQLP